MSSYTEQEVSPAHHGRTQARLGEALRWACADSSNIFSLADEFLGSGMGFLCSSPSAQMGRRTLRVGAEVSLSAAERQVFRDHSIERI